jgi:hypothetical protein
LVSTAAARRCRALADAHAADTETVTAQLLPALEAHGSRTALVAHLADLLGPAPAAKQFAARYAEQRFPSPPPPQPVAVAPKPASSAAPKARGKKAALFGAAAAPRAIDARSLAPPSGQAYIKTPEHAPAASSSRRTQVQHHPGRPLVFSPPPAAPARAAQQAPASSSDAEAAGSSSPAEPALPPLQPTLEMQTLDAAIAALTAEADGPAGKRRVRSCFCHGESCRAPDRRPRCFC